MTIAAILYLNFRKQYLDNSQDVLKIGKCSGNNHIGSEKIKEDLYDSSFIKV